MLHIRPSQERGGADHGWLKTQHSFSFADYYDPQNMGYRSLRVINEDHIEGGTGFGMHGHRDMEIITYIVSGALEHKDSMGTTAVIRPGEVQHMSAGRGVMHSEYNKLSDQGTHLFQIWILPDKNGIQPGYGQKDFSEALNTKSLVLVASHDGREGSLPIHQDADMYISRLKAGQKIDFSLRPKRGAWVQVVRGELEVNGRRVNSGDGVAIEQESALLFQARSDAEFILFDLL
jgi:hypothetical protein